MVALKSVRKACCPVTQVRNAGPVLAQFGDQVPGGGALRGPGRDHVDRGHVAVQAVFDADRARPGQMADRGGVGGDPRVAGRQLGHDRDRVGAQAREVGVQVQRDLAALAALGQRARVAQAVVDVQERQRGGQQQAR